MGSRDYCAYNQTRECFLALEIARVSVPTMEFAELPATFAFNAGEGAWMVPFNERSVMGTGTPIDLVFLDGNATVVEVAESTFSLSHTRVTANVASILAVPRHTIYSSQTQPGDQLIICNASEMARRLEKISNGVHGKPAEEVPTPMEIQETRPHVRLVDETERSNVAVLESSPPRAVLSVAVEKSVAHKRPRSWWSRWWSQDPRKARRESVDNLVAYYWTGEAAAPQNIRDISPTGVYIVTGERWYPGTLVLMAIQPADGCEGSGRAPIRVHARAVRWGEDGVGFEFVLLEPGRTPGETKASVEAVDRNRLETFVRDSRRVRP